MDLLAAQVMQGLRAGEVHWRCADQRPSKAVLTMSMSRGVPCKPCGMLAGTCKAGKRWNQKTERDAFSETLERKERLSRGMLLTASLMVNSTC